MARPIKIEPFSKNIDLNEFADSDGIIEGLGIPYGGRLTNDKGMSCDFDGEYFDAKTNFKSDIYDGEKLIKTMPVLYHHGLDETLGKSVIGYVTEIKETDKGKWFKLQLDKAHEYYKYLLYLAKCGALSLSTGAKKATKDASGHIKTWELEEISITPSACNPMAQIATKSLKALDMEANVIKGVNSNPMEEEKVEVTTEEVEQAVAEAVTEAVTEVVEEIVNPELAEEQTEADEPTEVEKPTEEEVVEDKACEKECDEEVVINEEKEVVEEEKACGDCEAKECEKPEEEKACGKKADGLDVLKEIASILNNYLSNEVLPMDVENPDVTEEATESIVEEAEVVTDEPKEEVVEEVIDQEEKADEIVDDKEEIIEDVNNEAETKENEINDIKEELKLEAEKKSMELTKAIETLTAENEALKAKVEEYKSMSAGCPTLRRVANPRLGTTGEETESELEDLLKSTSLSNPAKQELSNVIALNGIQKAMQNKPRYFYN